MAGSSFFALLDDITALLDDIAVMSKVATKKTAGVLGDDLALNAEQVSGVKADRELPVVWAVAKGSFINKCILVPAAIVISLVASWAIMPLLMIGGGFLCYEGFEKVYHRLTHSKESQDQQQKHIQALKDPQVDIVALEKNKIKNAIRTDFILSAEIIAIILGTVASAPFLQQVLVLIFVPLAVTVGVYVLVAGIVKLDDAGLYLAHHPGTGGLHALKRAFGRRIVISAPYLMKLLTIVGTTAMFLVGGGIIAHGVPFLHHLVAHLSDFTAHWPAANFSAVMVSTIAEGIIGVIAGGVILGVISTGKKFWRSKPKP